ncbi:hypothetical protein [uncultured Kordia sp.]|uniref:hypothetical protein n=1 Tax=uncultured Kordia sp. TaxID=507699 RepID=UPI0026237FF0|nr:hypothetical protein [uncultured Kordia sp.]
MANATATHKNGVCTITLPSETSSVIVVPNTSGKAQWENFCTWTNTTDSTNPQALGEWSAHQKNLNIVSNPLELISASSKHGTLSQFSNPASTGITTMTLALTHKKNPTSTSPASADQLNVVTADATPDVTVFTINAEDGGDTNYLDFYLTVTVIDI